MDQLGTAPSVSLVVVAEHVVTRPADCDIVALCFGVGNLCLVRLFKRVSTTALHTAVAGTYIDRAFLAEPRACGRGGSLDKLTQTALGCAFAGCLASLILFARVSISIQISLFSSASHLVERDPIAR